MKNVYEKYVKIDSLRCSVVDIDTINTKSNYGFIYVTINKVNGKLYLGKKAFRLKNGTVNAWRVYLGSGKLLKEEIKSYGNKNFKRYILALARTNNELIKLEKKYIKMFNAHDSDQWLNIRVGSALTREENPRIKSISVYDSEKLINTFNSVTECAKYYNLHHSYISRNAKSSRIIRSGL